MDYEGSASEGEVEGGKKQRRSAAGRKLMRWNPDVDQYVLLAVDIACSEQGTPVPWEYVAAKVNDYLTGEGIKQHLAKVRKYREQNGRPVPHKNPKGGNRKPPAYSTCVTNTSRRISRGKNVDDDDEVTGKGASLLWTDPKKKPKELKEPAQPNEVRESREGSAGETQTQKQKDMQQAMEQKKGAARAAEPAIPKTPSNRSRKSNTSSENFEVTAGKKKSTGKRSRAKKDMIDEDEADYNEDVSPSKKQRVPNLRATYYVNYDESQHFDNGSEGDIFNADPKRDGEDDEYQDDMAYGSQPSAVMQSEGASTHSSRASMTAQMETPPTFGNTMQSHAGMNPNGEEYIYPGPFTGLYNSYGPPGWTEMHAMGSGMSGGDASVNQSSHFTGLTADQQQVFVRNNAFNSFGYNQYEDLIAPPSKARKQGSRGKADTAEEGTVIPLGKNKRRSQDSTTKAQSTKRGAVPKQRKDSVLTGSFGGNQLQNTYLNGDSGNYGYDQQQNNYFNGTSNNYGNILIADDNSRGITPSGFGGGGSDSVSLLTTNEPQQIPALTTFPTDMRSINSLMGGLPSSSDNTHTGSTGITPQFNRFGFETTDHAINTITNSNSIDVTMPHMGGYGDHGGVGNFDDPFGGMDLTNFGYFTNANFSNSNDTSAHGSQSDQVMADMQLGGYTGVGLGVEDAWMGSGREGQHGGHEEDLFSLINHEPWH